jgi:hypothetical protein
MEIEISFGTDAAIVLSKAGEFLGSQPVLHNVMLTILHGRITQPEPGRYWVAMRGGKTVGVVLQSPLSYAAALTPMEPPVVAAVVEAITEAGVSLPGVGGEAATAANFAGHWTEKCKAAAIPFQGNRIYELFKMAAAPKIAGTLRQAGPKDRSLVIEWTHQFLAETGEIDHETERRVDGWLATGSLWLWDDGEAASIALNQKPIAGVVRLSLVYTPPAKRKRGYAAACVHALSKNLGDKGYRCILYTDLGNSTSNSIYRRIGYKAVAEVLRYRFE